MVQLNPTKWGKKKTKKPSGWKKKPGEDGLVTSIAKGAFNWTKDKLKINKNEGNKNGGNKKTSNNSKLNKSQKTQKKSDQNARKQAIRSDAAGNNIGQRSRFVGRAEARSYLPDRLRKKPKHQWTARDKREAQKAELSGMHKTTKRVNDRKSGNVAKNIKSRLPGGY